MEQPRPKTAADYAAIAVAPVLIFLMISSLANFLMLVLYHGNQPQRVAWTLLMFTMGTVAIARVAIEKDRAYSLGYAGILGFVAFVAMLKFVDSPVFSAFILVLIGYLSDRIVHDCTLIDDTVDASGQGLIDSGRLFVKQQLDSHAQDGASSEPATSKQTAPDSISRQQLRRQHQPGRTVMYLALAALPLFGLGQFLMRDDPATWRRAQWLLAVYLFSSLSLLVTTSFLGLRRYLRQRKVDMPTDVSVGWLSGGLLLVAAILLIAYLAPMPGRAIASFQLPEFLDSPGELTASRFGWGEEAAEKKTAGAATTQDPDPGGKEIENIAAQRGAPAGAASDGQRDQGPTGQSEGGKQSGSQGQNQAPNQSTNQSPSQRGSQPSQGSGQSSSADSQRSNQNQVNRQSQGDSPPPRQSPNRSQESGNDAPQGGAERDSSGRNRSQNNSDEASSPSTDADPSNAETQAETKPNTSSPISDLLPSLSGIVRWMVFLALVGILVAFLWLNRDAILAWWQRLTRTSAAPTEESFEELIRSQAGPAPRAFHTFRNPFGTEQDPRRIVVITFAAFEAWSREQGSTRAKDETPSEFIRRAAKSLPQVSNSASQVVDAYNRIVYGRGRATDHDLAAAKEVWNTMRSA